MTPDFMERISQDPAIMVGKPCIKGTRMPVYILVSHIARGRSRQEILADFPYLTEEDIQAAIDYAAWRSAERVIDLPETA